MKNWTIVLKTVASLNTLGEYTYAIRASTESEAVVKARGLFEVQHPSKHGTRRKHPAKVTQVVCWDLIV